MLWVGRKWGPKSQELHLWLRGVFQLKQLSKDTGALGRFFYFPSCWDLSLPSAYTLCLLFELWVRYVAFLSIAGQVTSGLVRASSREIPRRGWMNTWQGQQGLGSDLTWGIHSTSRVQMHQLLSCSSARSRPDPFMELTGQGRRQAWEQRQKETCNYQLWWCYESKKRGCGE